MRSRGRATPLAALAPCAPDEPGWLHAVAGPASWLEAVLKRVAARSPSQRMASAHTVEPLAHLTPHGTRKAVVVMKYCSETCELYSKSIFSLIQITRTHKHPTRARVHLPHAHVTVPTLARKAQGCAGGTDRVPPHRAPRLLRHNALPRTGSACAHRARGSGHHARSQVCILNLYSLNPYKATRTTVGTV